MASRVIEAGTVIARTRFLLATGVLKERPLWVDVAEAFPPIDQLPPRHKAKHLYYGKAKKLSYSEDNLRRWNFCAIIFIHSLNMITYSMLDLLSVLAREVDRDCFEIN